MELVKRWRTALRENAGHIGWSIAGGAIGAGIGLMAVTLYLAAR
ncbi:hypothetical protein ACWC1C_01465 [Streptomyces sp. NPDC001705]